MSKLTLLSGSNLVKYPNHYVTISFTVTSVSIIRHGPHTTLVSTSINSTILLIIVYNVYSFHTEYPPVTEWVLVSRTFTVLSQSCVQTDHPCGQSSLESGVATRRETFPVQYSFGFLFSRTNYYQNENKSSEGLKSDPFITKGNLPNP